MKIKENMTGIIIALILVAGVGALIINATTSSKMGTDLKIPAFSQTAQFGQVAYDENCAACHGKNGVGSEQGPPFINKVYNPGHHSNEAFLRAVRRGVPQHHWRFGDMPPQPQITMDQIREIVAYVRELQVANGIKYQKHVM
jgi:mono/diheme cytochrome c family protein